MILFLLAAAAGQADVAPTSKPNPAEEKVICRRPETFDTGTHMRAKKICMKASDWELAERQTQRELQGMRDRGIDPGRADPPR